MENCLLRASKYYNIILIAHPWFTYAESRVHDIMQNDRKSNRQAPSGWCVVVFCR